MALDTNTLHQEQLPLSLDTCQASAIAAKEPSEWLLCLSLERLPHKHAFPSSQIPNAMTAEIDIRSLNIFLLLNVTALEPIQLDQSIAGCHQRTTTPSS